jgi:hypothetical protein
MTEPDTEAATSGQSALQNIAGVLYLVQNVLTTLQQAGVENVQVGGGVGTWTSDFAQYVQAFASLPIDFFDMHIYSINKGYFVNALTAADAMLAAGKQVAVSECWTFKERDSELGTIDHTTVNGRDPFSFFQPIDVSFLEAIIHFAEYKHAAFVSPYWVNYFFAYLPYNRYASLSPSAVLTTSYRASSDAMQAGAFTPTGQYWRTSQIPPDTTPPAAPAAPTTSVIEANSINLQWEADTDNVGVSAYNLYRNGSLLRTTSELFYYDSGLVSATTYTYNLTATDASGNVSAMSAPLKVETAHSTVPSLALSAR